MVGGGEEKYTAPQRATGQCGTHLWLLARVALLLGNVVVEPLGDVRQSEARQGVARAALGRHICQNRQHVQLGVLVALDFVLLVEQRLDQPLQRVVLGELAGRRLGHGDQGRQVHRPGQQGRVQLPLGRQLHLGHCAPPHSALLRLPGLLLAPGLPRRQTARRSPRAKSKKLFAPTLPPGEGQRHTGLAGHEDVAPGGLGARKSLKIVFSVLRSQHKPDRPKLLAGV